MHTPNTPLLTSSLAPLLARSLLAAIFLLSGLAKLGAGYAPTQGYMEAMGVPGALLPLVILAELGGGAALLLGLLTRFSAAALAVFTLAAGVLFHAGIGDQNQLVHLLKNIAIAGGLLMLAIHGPGRWSLDRLAGRVATPAALASA
jgi:putative oxidoreductase